MAYLLLHSFVCYKTFNLYALSPNASAISSSFHLAIRLISGLLYVTAITFVIPFHHFIVFSSSVPEAWPPPLLSLALQHISHIMSCLVSNWFYLMLSSDYWSLILWVILVWCLLSRRQIAHLHTLLNYNWFFYLIQFVTPELQMLYLPCFALIWMHLWSVYTLINWQYFLLI